MKAKLTAKGTFKVEMKPESQNKVDEITLGRYSIDKVFQGDLQASSKFEMLGANADNGAGAYVALEQVKGKLHNKSGTFLLTHCGTMTKDSQQLTVLIAAECSTGELAGMEGKMTINIVDKEHHYELEYTLDSPAK